MGYTITVGNAVPKFDKSDFPDFYATWEVEVMTCPDAPTFINDEMTGNSNSRSPSYSAWSDFAKAAGIYELLFESGTLKGGHPGCYGITQEMADEISLAKSKWENKSKLPPGFHDWDYDGDDVYDYTLARLMWLDFWVNWALKNCETPAISNY